jgi:fused signal recognition particle receptor
MWAAIKARLFGREAEEPEKPPPAGPAERNREGPPSPPPSRPKDSFDTETFTEGFFGHRIREKTLEEVLDDLEIVLLQSDVALPVTERIRIDLRKRLAGRKLRFGVEAEGAIRQSLELTVREILDRPPFDLVATIRSLDPKPYIILFVGVNGTGKTTTVAKLAHWLSGQGLGVAIAAGDTFRAGAIEQLLVHGERLGIKVVRQSEGSDPAAVAFDAVQHARAKSLPVVLIDTAGRQHTNLNLIEEAKKIRRVVAPHLTLFVGDALTGNDVVEQAKLFQKELGVDGLILNKLDADVKGGAALSATFVTHKPILFVGVGQGYSDFRPFDADWMVERLFAEGKAV